MDEMLTISDEEYLRILATVRTARNIDLTNYQPIITKHRFVRFAQDHGFQSASMLIERLQTDKIFIELFLKSIKVSTTEMFRDPQTWIEINRLLNDKLKQEAMIKIWVPDVCGDDELNSLLILLSKNGMLHKSMVYATSAYQFCLDGCMTGTLDNKKYEISETNYKKMGDGNTLSEFVSQRDRFHKFSPQLLGKAIFIKQSVVNDNPPDQGFNLILFRNRSLYYTNPAKKKLLEQLSKSLIPGGYLVMGIGENINGLDVASQYTQISKSEKIFRKK